MNVEFILFIFVNYPNVCCVYIPIVVTSNFSRIIHTNRTTKHVCIAQNKQLNSKEKTLVKFLSTNHLFFFERYDRNRASPVQKCQLAFTPLKNSCIGDALSPGLFGI